MREYKAMYILHPELDEDQRNAMIALLNEVFTNNASNVVKVDEWGLRELAYEINDLKRGYYVVLNVEATPEAVSEYNRICNIREDVIRHIIVLEE